MRYVVVVVVMFCCCCFYCYLNVVGDSVDVVNTTQFIRKLFILMFLLMSWLLYILLLL